METSNCERQADVLSYWDSAVSGPHRDEIEAHIGTCEDCRELLAVLATTSPLECRGPISEDQVDRQVERIKEYAEGRINIGHVTPAASAATTSKPRFLISFPQLAAAALVICALGIGGWYLLSGPDAVKEANQLVDAAMSENGRRTQGWLSEMGFATYSATRGAEVSEDPKLSLALEKLSALEQSGTAPQKLALARTRIATGKLNEVVQGLELLEKLSNTDLPAETMAQVLNDKGVAELHLRHYEAAIDSFSKALQKSPNQPQALFNLAVAQESAGRDMDARTNFQKFIDSAPDEKWKAEARSHIELLDRVSPR